MKKDKTIAIVPGSFDPITFGHLDIIRRAAEMFDTVIVAVMINSNKEYMFNIEQRTAIVRAALKEDANISVVSSEGMLWQLCRDLDAGAIVKGYRNQADLDYEMQMAEFNEAHYPKAKTLLLKSDPALDHVTSTLVRKMISKNAPLQEFIPQSAINLIYDIAKQTKI